MAGTRAHDHWRRHVQRWKASGLSRRDYATLAKLNPQTLSWYAWKLKSVLGKPNTSKNNRPATAAVELAPGVPVVEVLPAPTTASSIEVDLDDITIRIPVDFEASALARLLDILEARR
ncbi:MAG: hypothetical protein K0V04_26940 [Deltaproteobacteria bacterium]|nr:hypothetical protein [Deltaproteobacteria bacterium]